MALKMFIEKAYTYVNKNNANDEIEKTRLMPNAYVQITGLSGDKNKMQLEVTVYEDKTKKICVECEVYTFSPSVVIGSTNFIQQGYEYLKTLPEYAEAVDC